MTMLFETVNGLEKVAFQEISEKLNVIKTILFPYGPRGWVKCNSRDTSLMKVGRLRSIIEAYLILNEERYSQGFSIDHFADVTVKMIPVYAANARRISVSAYSSYRRPSQREIQGAFSNRINKELNAECNLKDYDTSLKISLLRKVAIASIDLEIQPGNIPKLETHPTPLLPPIAYCMIRLAVPQKNEQLVDPMCGCGTIPLLASLEWKDLKVIGLDIEDEYLSSARRNAETLSITDRIEFAKSDIADLANTGIAADMVVVNPPYGMTVPARSQIERLYGTLLETSNKVLSSSGRMVIITPYPRIIEKEVQQTKMRIDSSYRIREGKPPRTIQVIRRAH